LALSVIAAREAAFELISSRSISRPASIRFSRHLGRVTCPRYESGAGLRDALSSLPFALRHRSPESRSLRSYAQNVIIGGLRAVRSKKSRYAPLGIIICVDVYRLPFVCALCSHVTAGNREADWRSGATLGASRSRPFAADRSVDAAGRDHGIRAGLRRARPREYGSVVSHLGATCRAYDVCPAAY